MHACLVHAATTVITTTHSDAEYLRRKEEATRAVAAVEADDADDAEFAALMAAHGRRTS